MYKITVLVCDKCGALVLDRAPLMLKHANSHEPLIGLTLANKMFTYDTIEVEQDF